MAISRVSRDSRQSKFLLLRASSQGRIGGSQRRLRFLLHWLSQPLGFKVSGHQRERRKDSCRVLEKRNSLRAGHLHPLILLLRTPSCAIVLKPPSHPSDRRETSARSRVIRARRYAGKELIIGKGPRTSAARSLFRPCMRILNNDASREQKESYNTPFRRRSRFIR